MGLVAVSLILGNLITFIIVSYALRNNDRDNPPEAVAAEISTLGGLLASAATQTALSQLIADARRMGIVVEDIKIAALKAVPAGKSEHAPFTKRLAEKKGCGTGTDRTLRFHVAGKR